jgi:diketogulonate reductase-like aldo/keto reductase
MSLKRLQLEYVDLYLMHWPIAMNPQGTSDSDESPKDSRFPSLCIFSFLSDYHSILTKGRLAPSNRKP